MLNKIKNYLCESRFHFNRLKFNIIAVFFLACGFIGGTYLALFRIYPQIKAVNDTVKIWTLNTNSSADFTTTEVAINNSGAYPTGGQIGANEFTNPDFQTNNTSWSVAAVPVPGWVEVPGNPITYATDNFLVMQYEAKYDCTGDGIGDTAAVCSAPADSGLGVDYRDLSSSFTNTKVVSTAEGAPLTHVTHPQAVAACPTGSHLITNQEWMTIMRNAELQSSNWADNATGSLVSNGGGLKRGNVGINDSASYDGPDVEFGTGRNAKAMITLSNGSTIWDMSGNVWENVMMDKNDTLLPQNMQPTLNTTADDGDGVAGWGEFTAISSYANLSYDEIRPSVATYNFNHGVGRIYTYGDGETATTSRVLFRGGYWNSGLSGGLASLYLGNFSGYQYSFVGFRCAIDQLNISQTHYADAGIAGGGNVVSVGTAVDAKIYQSLNVVDAGTYRFSAYVYNNTSGSEGLTINADTASLYANNSVLTTTYESVGNGWYKLTATLTASNENNDYGLLIKAGKSVKIDDLSLIKETAYTVYNTVAYSTPLISTWDSFCEGTLVGSVCTENAIRGNYSNIVYQICTNDGSACEANQLWQYWNGSAWVTATNIITDVNEKSQLTQTAMQALSITSKKISIKAIFTSEAADVPYLPNFSIGYTTDVDKPEVNGQNLVMFRNNGGTAVSVNGWTNNSAPVFSWTAGSDTEVGSSGIKGYCLSLSIDNNEDGLPDNDPATAKGLLGESPVETAGTTCQFIVAGTSIDFATSSYKGATWLTTNNKKYILAVKIIDNAGNIYEGEPTTFSFRFDNTPPTNVAYISCASGSFSNVADMNFSWPNTGNVTSIDENSGLLGWQYQINSTTGPWLGTMTEAVVGVNKYLPTNAAARVLTQVQDSNTIVAGNNIVYFRSVDIAGNVSLDSAIRTCNLSYGGAAPAFDSLAKVTVSPTNSTTNNYALSWPNAIATAGQSVTNYYYMVNTTPPATLATLQSNATTYIDNGALNDVSLKNLPNVNKGTNTIYVVAIDNNATPNYSPSNYISGTFILDSTNPDNATSLVVSDSSIKNLSQWNVTLTWAAPIYKGAGNLTYLIYRSTDGTNFSQIGSTSGLSYVDNVPTSTKFYYKIYTKDGANATSSGTNSVTIVPTGKWTNPPTLDSGPEVGSITTKKAVISWTTSRPSDSKVQYGIKSELYYDVEPSNSNQSNSHLIEMTGLNPGTTYYFKAKWTDEDGNTGVSEEKTFTTANAPTVKDVSAKNISLSSAMIEFTSKDAKKVKIYYGLTTNFGGMKEISTSTSETVYTAELTELLDGTKYYYKINTFDDDNSEYEGTVLDFTTLPRPKISNVRIQQIANTAQSAVFVTWSSNTEVSSIVTYYPENNLNESRDEVNIELIKGEHKIIIRSLMSDTNYILIVKGRDRMGNEAISDIQRITTATDTRPPKISDLKIEGSVVPSVNSTAQESKAQLVISWNTDEPATSQVAFGEGTGTVYTSKTQEDSNLTYNHLVIVSGLTPSKVYHVQAMSTDKANNRALSNDTVTITPKATENALDLVIASLSAAFGFLGKLK